MTPQPSPAVQQNLVENFVKAYGAFVEAVRTAVNETISNAALANTPAFLSWQVDALPLLEQQNAEVREAYARFLIGETQTIVSVASERSHIGKELDGLPLTFAGPDRAPAFEKLLTAVVTTAYQICASAGVP
jgi:hypothetical protein